MDFKLDTLDVGIVIGYFLLILYIAYRAVRKDKATSESSFENSEDYFLGGRDLVGLLLVRHFLPQTLAQSIW